MNTNIVQTRNISTRHVLHLWQHVQECHTRHAFLHVPTAYSATFTLTRRRVVNENTAHSDNHHKRKPENVSNAHNVRSSISMWLISSQLCL